MMERDRERDGVKETNGGMRLLMKNEERCRCSDTEPRELRAWRRQLQWSEFTNTTPGRGYSARGMGTQPIAVLVRTASPAESTLLVLL